MYGSTRSIYVTVCLTEQSYNSSHVSARYNDTAAVQPAGYQPTWPAKEAILTAAQ
jgi:hypothetical protein